MSRTITLTFHSDPGHGWIEVPLLVLNQLNIHNKISGCSYMQHRTAYLEEDCDAGILMDALKAHSPDAEFKFIEKNTNEDSFIRNLPRYPA
jgi:hypothetical protein